MEHGYFGACSPDNGAVFASQKTFSVGVFELRPKKRGGGFKRGWLFARVRGDIGNEAAVYAKAQEIVNLVDHGKWDKTKRQTITVKRPAP